MRDLSEFAVLDDTDLQALPDDGFSVVQIPPPMVGSAERQLWQRIQTQVLLGLPPATPTEHLLRTVLAELRSTPTGSKVSIAAVMTGVSLGIAMTHGVRIRTDLRDLARDLGVRYQMLLNIRKAAARVIREQSIHMDLPEWLGWEWS